MGIDLQFKIKNNPYYLEYLRQNSYWYKYLNRNPESFKTFEEAAREYFKLRPSDRIEKVLTSLEMIGSIVSTLK